MRSFRIAALLLPLLVATACTDNNWGADVTGPEGTDPNYKPPLDAKTYDGARLNLTLTNVMITNIAGTKPPQPCPDIALQADIYESGERMRRAGIYNCNAGADGHSLLQRVSVPGDSLVYTWGTMEEIRLHVKGREVAGTFRIWGWSGRVVGTVKLRGEY